MIDPFILAAVSLILISFLLSPKFSIFLLAFSAPIINWALHPFGLEVPFSDLIGILAFLAWILVVLFSLVFKPKKKFHIRFPLFFPFFLFLGANLLSLLNSHTPLSGLYYILRWPFLLYVIYIFLPTNIIKKEKELKAVVWSLVLISFIIMISGWLSLLGQDWHNSFFRLNSISFWGIYPFGVNHNLIAESLNIASFLWLALALWTKENRLKRLYQALFLLTIISAIMTFSRSSWITIFVQALIYLFYRYRHINREQGKSLILGIMIIALASLPVFWRMDVLQADNTSSTENRVLLTEIAYNSWQEKPWLGQGSGSFTTLVANNIRFRAKYGDPIDSHGFLQKIIAENGLIGMLTWLFLILVIVKKAAQSINKYMNKAPWLLALWTAAAGGLFFQIFNTSYYKGKVWLIITLSLIAVDILEKKYGKEA